MSQVQNVKPVVKTFFETTDSYASLTKALISAKYEKMIKNLERMREELESIRKAREILQVIKQHYDLIKDEIKFIKENAEEIAIYYSDLYNKIVIKANKETNDIDEVINYVSELEKKQKEELKRQLEIIKEFAKRGLLKVVMEEENEEEEEEEDC